MVEILNSLYFEEFGSEDRQILHKAARIYLQHGGTFQTSSSDDVKNELVRSHFLLYLYKKLASHENVKEPSNLHRLSSLAASRAGEELNFKEISDQVGVDRRTVDSYLATLEQGKAVSESHDFSLQRHRRTRLFLRNPRHVVLLSNGKSITGLNRSATQVFPTLNSNTNSLVPSALIMLNGSLGESRDQMPTEGPWNIPK